jgi:DNA-binding NarL/FixJ family response regulator
MAFGGNLEELPFSDIMQLLHVSKKSGTLNIAGPSGSTRIVCRGGFIMDATFPGDSGSIFQRLLRAGLVTEVQLQNIRVKFLPQEIDGARLVMGLIEAGYLGKDQGIDMLKAHIHQTLAEIITWTEGDFSFDVDDMESENSEGDLSVDMGPWIGVDTQGALMDAFRVFDEKNRSIEEQKERKKELIKEAVARISLAPGPPSLRFDAETSPVPAEIREAILKEQECEEKDLLSVLEEMDEETLSQVLAPPMHALILSDDSFTKHAMHHLCRDNGISATVSDVEVDLREAVEMGVADRHSMALVVDLGSGAFDSLLSQRRLAVAKRLKSGNPELPLVILAHITEDEGLVRLFDMGARTVLSRPPRQTQDVARMVESSKRFNALILACLKGIFREEYRLRLVVQESRSQMASLKMRVQEIQDRKNTVDVPLIVLQFVAELLQRGILFLVRKTDLLGLGSFGVSSHKDTISTAAMRIRIPLQARSILSDVVERGIVYYGDTEDPTLKEYLHSHIGAPASSKFLLLPLKTENKTIALVYCDFGQKPASPAVKTDALEIFASQAGMAMEIALRHRLDEKRVGT